MEGRKGGSRAGKYSQSVSQSVSQSALPPSVSPNLTSITTPHTPLHTGRLHRRGRRPTGRGFTSHKLQMPDRNHSAATKESLPTCVKWQTICTSFMTVTGRASASGRKNSLKVRFPFLTHRDVCFLLSSCTLPLARPFGRCYINSISGASPDNSHDRLTATKYCLIEDFPM